MFVMFCVVSFLCVRSVDRLFLFACGGGVLVAFGRMTTIGCICRM